MQILKSALITMLALTSFNLFISPEYNVERSMEINVPANIVYKQVTDLHKWENWADLKKVCESLPAYYISLKIYNKLIDEKNITYINFLIFVLLRNRN